MKRSLSRKAFASVFVVLMVLSGGVASVAAQADPIDGCDYFDETGHNLCSPFLEFWDKPRNN